MVLFETTNQQLVGMYYGLFAFIANVIKRQKYSRQRIRIWRLDSAGNLSVDGSAPATDPVIYWLLMAVEKI